jgi:DNA-binding transcriptional ArsR family regulator
MKRPHGTGGVIRRWILRAAEEGVTTLELSEHFGMLLTTAASHLRKLREIGLIEDDGAERPEGGSIRNVITAEGRDYLAANGGSESGKYDHRALSRALGMMR